MCFFYIKQKNFSSWMCTRNLKSDCFSRNLMEILLFEQKSRTPFWRVIYPSPSLSQQKNRNILHTNKIADTAILPKGMFIPLTCLEKSIIWSSNHPIGAPYVLTIFRSTLIYIFLMVEKERILVCLFPRGKSRQPRADFTRNSIVSVEIL